MVAGFIYDTYISIRRAEGKEAALRYAAQFWPSDDEAVEQPAQQQGDGDAQNQQPVEENVQKADDLWSEQHTTWHQASKQECMKLLDDASINYNPEDSEETLRDICQKANLI